MKQRRIVLAMLLVLTIGLTAALAVLLVMLRTDEEPPPEALTPGVTHVATIYGWGDDDASLLKEPYSVAFNGGFLYATEKARGDVVRLTTSGDLDAVIGSQGMQSGQISSPTGLAVDDQGNVYVSDGGHAKIVVYDASGAFTREIPVDGSPLAPLVDGPRLFITTEGSVKILDLAAGTELSSWGIRGRGDDQFDFPNGIAFDPGAQLVVVADGNNLRVKALNLQGDTIWTFGKPPTNMNETDREFGLAGGLAVANGHIFVTDPLDSVIHILDMKGTKVAEVGSPGVSNGQFSFPSSIAYMGGNRFVITEWGNQRLQILDIDVDQAAEEWRRTVGATTQDTSAPAATPTTAASGSQ